MPDAPQTPIDLAEYWNRRYDTVDATRSGHIDLPVEYNLWLYRRKQDHARRALAEVGASLRGARLLEIAAGSGAWIPFWEGQGVSDYCGVDISERAIEALQGRFPARRLFRHDLNDLNIAGVVGAGYDCVSAIDVLYHVVDDGRFAGVLKDLASVVKPGGILLLHDQFLHGPPQNYGGYIRWRRLADYQAALESAGFEVLYRRPTFFFMVQAADYTGRPAQVMHAIWDHLTRPAIGRAPSFTGAVGYVTDTVICSLLRNGPSFNVMVCRKRS
jgi:SAM-dependent methyltransferase